MTRLEHVPAEMSHRELAVLLADVAARVHRGDSFEGFIEYVLGDEPERWLVRARYRIGNADGQGGMRIVGDFVEVEA